MVLSDLATLYYMRNRLPAWRETTQLALQIAHSAGLVKVMNDLTHQYGHLPAYQELSDNNQG